MKPAPKPEAQEKEGRKRKQKRRRQSQGSTGIRLKSVVPERAEGSSQIRLRSVARDLQTRRQRVRDRHGFVQRAIRRAREVWPNKRFRERVAIGHEIAQVVPRGSVGQTLLRQLPPECSSCDERFENQKIPARDFANKRIQQRRQESKAAAKEVPARRPESLQSTPRLTPLLRKYHTVRKKVTKPFPPLPQVEEEEEEGTDIDETNPLNKKDGQSDGDGSGPDYGGDDEAPPAIGAN